jgi:hypothetical protein
VSIACIPNVCYKVSNGNAKFDRCVGQPMHLTLPGAGPSSAEVAHKHQSSTDDGAEQTCQCLHMRIIPSKVLALGCPDQKPMTTDLGALMANASSGQLLVTPARLWRHQRRTGLPTGHMTSPGCTYAQRPGSLQGQDQFCGSRLPAVGAGQ